MQWINERGKKKKRKRRGKRGFSEIERRDREVLLVTLGWCHGVARC
jgi:hypothetical protein